MKKSEIIWEAFCNELIVESTDDMKEALATSIREIVNELQYYQCCEDDGVEDMVVDASALYELANEIEKL